MRSERFEVELPTDLAEFVHSQVGTGTMVSDADVVREAVRVLRQQTDRAAELRAMIAASIADPRTALTDEEVTDHFRRRAHG